MKPSATLLTHMALTCLWLGSTAAFAASPAPATQAVSRLPELVVKGTKDASLSDLQRMSVSASTFSADQIRLSGLDSIQDLTLLTPNLALSTSGGRSFGDNLSIRGLANSAFFSDPSVIVYVDDVPFGDVFTFMPDLYDIEHIDVRRGSQSTVFGKNSEAGVINITTRKPTNAHAGEATASIGNYGEQIYRASVMGPLVKDKLHYGLSGGVEMRDGYLHNTFLNSDPDSREGWNGRAFLRWTPTAEWSVTLDLNQSSFNDGAPRTQSLTAPEYTVDSDVPGQLETDNSGGSLRIVHTASSFTFTSITSRREWTLDPLHFDLDLTRFPSPGSGNYALIKQDQEQWTEELRLQSAAQAKQPLRWLAGFYFSSIDNHGNNTRNFFVPVPGFFETQTTAHTLETANFAVFGNATYATQSKLDITLGVRLDRANKKIIRNKFTTFFPPPRGFAQEEDFSNIGSDLTLGYHVSETLLAYGTTGTGFKAGGFSAFIDPPASARFADERVWMNEIGLKSTSADKKLTANLALFYYQIDNYQVERSVPFSTDYAVYNAPKTDSMGGEIEVHSRPVEGLDLSATFGYTAIEFDEFKNPGTGASLAGKRPPFVPEYNGSLAAQYRFSNGWFGRIEYVAVGKTYFDEENSDLMREDAYGMLNLRLGYDTPRLGIHVFGRNLTDDYHYEKRVAGLYAGVPGAPLTYGIMGTVRF